MYRTLLLTLLFIATPLQAQDKRPEARSPIDEQALISAAESAGKNIFVHDRAAAVTTDALMQLREFRKDKRVAGWITEEKDGNISVTFVGPRDTPTKHALYRAAVTTGGLIIGTPVALATPEALTAFEAGAFAARSVAFASGFSPCASTYNSVVLPANDTPLSGWLVYLLPGTTKQNVVPLGGTYRLEIGPEGTSVLTQRGFTRTCIQLGSEPGVVAMMVTHLLDPVPTEAHVFWSLWAAKPMYVSTSGGLWKIENGKVMRVERDAPGG